MKSSAKQVVIIVCSLALLVSCSPIKLHGGKGGPAPASAGTASTGSVGGVLSGSQQQTVRQQPVQQQASASTPPIVDGEWEVDYNFKGSPYMGNVMFSQTGTALAGAGADQDGREWQVDSGQIQGTKVVFGKKYANSSSPPIVYTGELKYLQTPEYTGWAMEGTYSVVSPDGKTLSDKWVANPTAPAAVAAPPPQQPAAVNPFFGGTAAPPPPRASAPDHIGDARPSDISGHYDGSYNFNFKKVKSKMWIESDGNKVTGRGYDIMDKAPASGKAKTKDKSKDRNKDKTRDKTAEQDSNEHFNIERGWYVYPNVTLIRQYTKGKGARETRSVTFRAQLSSNGRDIIMKGETQFGGSWDAHRL